MDNEEKDKLVQRHIAELAGTAQRAWPKGQIDDTDNGLVTFALITDKANKIVRFQFTGRLSWIGLELEDVKRLIVALEAKVKELESE